MSRSKAACADASETCCSRIRCTSVANPGARSHSGGRPYRSTIAGEVGVARRELGDRGVEARAVERLDQTTEPFAVKPPAGIGSNGRPVAPRSHARAFSPSEGRW